MKFTWIMLGVVLVLAAVLTVRLISSPLPASTPSSTSAQTKAVNPVSPFPSNTGTSYVSKKYTNTLFGFDFLYPAAWTAILKDNKDNKVLHFVSGTNQTDDDVFWAMVPSADQATAIKNFYDNDLKQYGATVNMISNRKITVAQNGIIVTEAVMTAKVIIYDIWAYGLAFDKNGYTFVLSGRTFKGQSNQDLIREICQTLRIY